MSTVSVIDKVRRILGDRGKTFTDQVAGDNITTRLTLSVSAVDPTTVTVGTIIPPATAAVTMAASDYTLDYYNGILTLASPVLAGNVLVVSGTAYEDVIPQDLLDYLQSAYEQHTTGRNPLVYLDAVANAVPPTSVLPHIEERPLALLTASMVYKDLATNSSQDITIDTGDGTVIPLGQRYQQLMQRAASLEEEYATLANRLGLQTFDSIQVSQMRRVSYTTGRLVPVYLEREWDDWFWPRRILPNIDTGLGGSGGIVSFVGYWNPRRIYAANDEIGHDGRLYLALQPNQGIDPRIDVEMGDGWNGHYWKFTTINSGLQGYYGGGLW